MPGSVENIPSKVHTTPMSAYTPAKKEEYLDEGTGRGGVAAESCCVLEHGYRYAHERRANKKTHTYNNANKPKRVRVQFPLGGEFRVLLGQYHCRPENGKTCPENAETNNDYAINLEQHRWFSRIPHNNTP